MIQPCAIASGLEKVENTSEKLDKTHSDRLVLKLLTQKFNSRYGKELTSEQRQIIEGYVFLSSKQDNRLREFFETKKKGSYSISDIDKKIENSIKKVIGNEIEVSNKEIIDRALLWGSLNLYLIDKFYNTISICVEYLLRRQ